jgi:hypothetical protein
MKEYPSIPQSIGTAFREMPNAYVFDKLDGSNLRFEWSRKRGWHKSGTRERLFDTTDPIFGEALPLFQQTLAEPLTRTFRDQRWDTAVVFCEFWGPGSFAGVHVPGEPKRLTILDVAPHKQGILGPRDFLDLFLGRWFLPERFEVPRFLGITRWTRGYVDSVRRGDVEGVTFEGVVGKAGEGHHQIRSKAKTQAWIDQVLARHGSAGQAIVDS